MNSKLIFDQLQLACGILVKKHDCHSRVSIEPSENGSLIFKVIISKDEIPSDQLLFEKHTTASLKTGHKLAQAQYPELKDGMLGKRFTVWGKSVIYLGFNRRRPKYPISILEVKPNGGTAQLKGPANAIPEMARQYAQMVESLDDGLIEKAMSRNDAEGLPNGGLF